MIYFVRHGLCESNVRRVFAGQKDDSPLVDEGRQQAKETAKKIREEGIKINKIVSSPLKRALETAQIIAKELGFDVSNIEIDNRIMEYDMGSFSGTTWGAVSSHILTSDEGSEDHQVFRDRIYSCLKELSKLPENILVVSHGAVGRMVETIKENKDIESFYDIHCFPNGHILKIDWIK